MNDRLYRSRDDRVLAGVAGGLAERLDLDPSLVRVVWAILIVLSGGLFLLLYVIMAIVVPEAPLGADRWAGWAASSAAPGPGAVPGWAIHRPAKPSPPASRRAPQARRKLPRHRSQRRPTSRRPASRHPAPRSRRLRSRPLPRRPARRRRAGAAAGTPAAAAAAAVER